MRYEYRVRALRALAATTLLIVTAPLAARAQCAAPRAARQGVWDTGNATVAPATTPDSTGIALVRGIACRADLAMDDGVIEMDIAPPRDGFLGVAFRMASSADYEIIYLVPDSSHRWVQAQYQPVYQGETTWQLYHRDGYLADLPAHIPTTADGWTHLRLAVAGNRADLYLGDEAVPVLRVRALQRPRERGGVGVWSAGGTSKDSANAMVRGLRVGAAVSLPSAGFAAETPGDNALTQWHVSPRFPAPDSTAFVDRLQLRARQQALNGRSVSADSSGLVSLTAAVGNPAGTQHTNVFGGAGWGLAYACVMMHSDVDQTRQLLLSYSDAIGVYVDGVRVFQGNNTYGFRGKAQFGTVGAATESVPLQLRAGDHEIVLAVADKAFGWGFRARLDSEQGIQIAP